VLRACSDSSALLHGVRAQQTGHANHSFQLCIFDWLYGYRYNLHACCSALQRALLRVHYSTKQIHANHSFPGASLIVAVRLSCNTAICVLVIQQCAAACAVLK
jgi:hypothetical protein